MSRWVQYDIAGNPMPDVVQRGCWARAARASAARWLKVASLAGEVQAALKRSRFVPAIPAKQYREWAKGETRPIPVRFYDGTIDHKRASLPRAMAC